MSILFYLEGSNFGLLLLLVFKRSLRGKCLKKQEKKGEESCYQKLLLASAASKSRELGPTQNMQHSFFLEEERGGEKEVK